MKLIVALIALMAVSARADTLSDAVVTYMTGLGWTYDAGAKTFSKGGDTIPLSSGVNVYIFDHPVTLPIPQHRPMPL